MWCESRDIDAKLTWKLDHVKKERRDNNRENDNAEINGSSVSEREHLQREKREIASPKSPVAIKSTKD